MECSEAHNVEANVNYSRSKHIATSQRLLVSDTGTLKILPTRLLDATIILHTSHTTLFYVFKMKLPEFKFSAESGFNFKVTNNNYDVSKYSTPPSRDQV